MLPAPPLCMLLHPTSSTTCAGIRKSVGGTLEWYEVWTALKINSRLVYFNLAFSLYHLPSVHSSRCLSSINECNQPPTCRRHHHQPPTTPGLPVSHSEPVTAIPQGPLQLPVFVKHNHRLPQPAAALTRAPVRHARLSIWTLWTVYIVKYSTVCFYNYTTKEKKVW